MDPSLRPPPTGPEPPEPIRERNDEAMELLGKVSSTSKTATSSRSGKGSSRSGGGAHQPQWRLFYLRRRVICFFLVTWALLIIAVELLLAFSDKNQGLVSSTSNFYYAWTYGPVAALTLFAAVWARVEFQSKLAAPWVRRSDGIDEARRAWTTDYLSMLQPTSIFRSLRNRDFGVAATTTVSILFTIMIIISSGLITLSPTMVTSLDVPITAQTQLLNDPGRLRNLEFTLPAYRLMIGLLQANLTFPAGVTSKSIYQTIQPEQPGNIKLRAQVEGLTPSIDCEPATIADTDFTFDQFDLGVTEMNSSLTSDNCKNMDVTFIVPSSNSGGDIIFSQLVLGGCEGSDDFDDRRIGIIYANGTGGEKSFTIHGSSQLLCKPSYTVRNFELVQNGTQMDSLVPAADTATRTLDKVHPWDIAQAYYNSHNIPYDYDAESPNALKAYPAYDEPLYLDRYTSIALFMDDVRPPNISSAFDPSTLAFYFEQYYKTYAALVAHQSLVESTPEAMTGTGLTIENRLIVHPLASHWIAALLAVCMLLALPVWLSLPKSNIIPRNPSSIIGIAALAKRKQHKLLFPTESRAAPEWDPALTDGGVNGNGGLPQPLHPSGTGYHPGNYGRPSQLPRSLRSRLTRPVVLHPVMRLGIASTVLIIIAALVVLLNFSRTGNGLGFVSEDSYMHFVWTSGPALILSLVRLHYSAADFQTRALAPYLNLKEGTNFRKSLKLDLLNQYTVTALSKATGIKLYTVSATSLVVLITAFLPVFSASLFFDSIFPQDFTSQLQLSSAFGSPTPLSASERLGFDLVPSIITLILEANLTYPPSTYENLVFPTFSLNSEEFNLSRASVDATLPAMRSQLTCKLYDSSAIRTNLTLNYTVPTYQMKNPLRINIEGEECGLDDEEITGSNFNFGTQWDDNGEAEGTFGFGDTIGSVTPGVLGCSRYLWVWGSISTTSQPPIKSISAMGCNVSVEVVDADVTLFGEDLHIDPDRPPVVKEETVRETKSFLNPIFRYDSLSSQGRDPNNSLLTTAFTFVTQSRYAIPFDMLADADQASTVAKALQFQHGVIVAQKIGGQLRVPATNDNFTLADAALTPVAGNGNSSVPFPVTARDPIGIRRVLQDETSTYIIVALLWATLSLALLAWALMGDSAILEGSPTSVEDVVALLRKGDVLDALPEGAEDMSSEDLARCFGGGTRFKLGWRWVTDGEPEYMLYTEKLDDAIDTQYRRG